MKYPLGDKTFILNQKYCQTSASAVRFDHNSHAIVLKDNSPHSCFRLLTLLLAPLLHGVDAYGSL